MSIDRGWWVVGGNKRNHIGHIDLGGGREGQKLEDMSNQMMDRVNQLVELGGGDGGAQGRRNSGG